VPREYDGRRDDRPRQRCQRRYPGRPINGNFTVNLTAPTSGTTKGIEDRVACASCGNKVNGGSSQSITGVIYFPKNSIAYSGGASTSRPVCTKLVANTISFKGNSTFNSSCTSSGTGTINLHQRHARDLRATAAQSAVCHRQSHRRFLGAGSTLTNCLVFEAISGFWWTAHYEA
jgi:hypothetical protein